MNIGSIAKNAAGHLVGRVSTLTVELTIALRPVHSANPNAPKFEVMALSAARSRPSRRRELPAEMAMPADDGLPPLPGEEASQAGQSEPDGLGTSSAPPAFAD